MENGNGVWRNLKGKYFTEPLEELIEKAIVREQAQGHKLKVCVGSDSKTYSNYVGYATVIVILRQGKGGFMYLSKSKGSRNVGLKERMLHEVGLSVSTAYSICRVLDRYGVDLEVHADINTDPKFESNTALKDAMGYILGMGFKFKAKPFAFASSSCADKWV